MGLTTPLGVVGHPKKTKKKTRILEKKYVRVILFLSPMCHRVAATTSNYASRWGAFVGVANRPSRRFLGKVGLFHRGE
jgi:hypothetical protein